MKSVLLLLLVVVVAVQCNWLKPRAESTPAFMYWLFNGRDCNVDSAVQGNPYVPNMDLRIANSMEYQCPQWLDMVDPDPLNVRQGVRIRDADTSLSSLVMANTTWNANFSSEHEILPVQMSIEVWVKPTCVDCFGIDVVTTGTSNTAYMSRYMPTVSTPKIGNLIAGMWSPRNVLPQGHPRHLVAIEDPTNTTATAPRFTKKAIGTQMYKLGVTEVTFGEGGNFFLGTGYINDTQKGLRFFVNSLQCYPDYCATMGGIYLGGSCDEIGTVDPIKQVTKYEDIISLWDTSAVHHVVATYNETIRKLYIDGVLVHSVTLPVNDYSCRVTGLGTHYGKYSMWWEKMYSFRVGSDGIPGHGAFTGDFHSIHVHKVELNQTEITQNFEAGYPSSPPTLHDLEININESSYATFVFNVTDFDNVRGDYQTCTVKPVTVGGLYINNVPVTGSFLCNSTVEYRPPHAEYDGQVVIELDSVVDSSGLAAVLKAGSSEVGGRVVINIAVVHNSPTITPLNITKMETEVELNITMTSTVGDGDVVIMKIVELPDPLWGSLASWNGTALDVDSTLTPGVLSFKFVRNTTTVNGPADNTTKCFQVAVFTEYNTTLVPAQVCMTFLNVLTINAPATINVAEETDHLFTLDDYVETRITMTVVSQVISLPSHGVLLVDGTDIAAPYNTSGVTYRPDVDYYGPDSFDMDAIGIVGAVESRTLSKTILINVVNVADLSNLTIANTSLSMVGCADEPPVNLGLNITDNDPTEQLSITVYSLVRNNVTGELNSTSTERGQLKLDSTPANGCIIGQSIGVSLQFKCEVSKMMQVLPTITFESNKPLNHVVAITIMDSFLNNQTKLIEINVTSCPVPPPPPNNTTDVIDDSPANSEMDPVTMGAVAGGAALIFGLFIFCGIKKRNKKVVIKLPPPPDFTPFIYGNDRTITAECKKFAAKCEPLAAMLLRKDKAFLYSLMDATQVTEADAFAKAAVYIYQSENRTMELLQETIQHEVALAETPSTLFRTNSMASKMLKVYSKMIGLDYLYNTLSLPLRELLANASSEASSLEVDPNKAGDSDNVKVNKFTLMATAQKVLEPILANVEKAPYDFRVICNTLQAGVMNHKDEAFHSSRHTVVGGFIFLRFFCPAITAPEQFGLVEVAPSQEASRHLVLVAKTLQNVANGVEFKEKHMENLNVFIRMNNADVNNFFDQLSKLPTTMEAAPVEQVPTPARENALVNLHHHVTFLMRKLSTTLPCDQYEELKKAMDSIGEAPKESK